VKNVWVARRPPGFAFVEMEDRRDAQEAARGLDGARIAGTRQAEKRDGCYTDSLFLYV
jgi:hypothetical protein